MANQLNDEERAEIENIVRAKAVHNLLDLGWEVNIGNELNDVAATQHARTCITRVCNEILAGMSMAEYVHTVATK